MDVLVSLLHGLANIFTPVNFAVLVIGLVLGMLVAVLPGLTLVMGVVLALPFTYKMGVEPALILLTAMYVSGTYGGAITAILFRIPGEPMDVPLLWDGYAMTRRGQAAKALGWSLVAALVGGLLSAVVMVALSQPVASIALSFSSPEFFAILLRAGERRRARRRLAGQRADQPVPGPVDRDRRRRCDLRRRAVRLRRAVPAGRHRVPAGDGRRLRHRRGADAPAHRLRGRGGAANRRQPHALQDRVSAVGRDTGRSRARSCAARRRASSSASCRARERRCRRSSPTASRASRTGKNGNKLGNGAPEGIVAAKSAATASVGGALVPLLAMGIPGSGATAIILAAFLLHGIQPGPQVFVSSTSLIYTVFAAVFVGVIGMCILGYFAIKPLCKVLDAPEAMVSAFVVVFCFIGAFAARNNLSDLYVIAVFGLVGFLFERFRFPIAPLVLGTILGPLDREQFHDDDGELRQRLDRVLHAPDQRHHPRDLDHRAGVPVRAHDRGTLARPTPPSSGCTPMNDLSDRSAASAADDVAALVARARAAQAVANEYDQDRVDELVAAAGWAIIEPARNRELAELAVTDTGIGNVDDKIRKNFRKTFGLLRDLKGVRSVGVIAEDPERGIVEIARPVGVVAAITPSTNPAATPANKIINALKGRNAIIVAPSPKGWSTCARLIEFIHQQFDRSARRMIWCSCCRRRSRRTRLTS